MAQLKQEKIPSRLCSPAICTACGACINACPFDAINWRKNDFDEQLPFITADLCRNCGVCEKACPQLSKMQGNLPVQSYGCWLKSSEDLAKSSSGGAARALSMAVIHKGGVVFGCTFSQGKNHHKAVVSIDELDELSGSKYVWSDVEYCYRELRNLLLNDDSRPILFIGTPCQVDGLKHFLGPLQDSPALFTVDLICHGTPPPDYIKDFLKDTEGDEPQSLVCRDRQGGALHGALKKGREFHYSGGFGCSMYLDAYVKGITYRERCYTCRYATPRRVGDVTLGDFWGIPRKNIPGDSPEVISIAYINSNRGKELFEAASPLMEHYPVSVYDAVMGKPNMLRPQKRPDVRNVFLKLLPKIGFTKAVRQSLHPSMVSGGGMKQMAREMAKKIAKLCCQAAYSVFFRFDSCIVRRNVNAKIVQLTTSDDEFLFSDYGVFFQNYAFRRTLASWGYVTYRQDCLLNHAENTGDNGGKWVKTLPVIAKMSEIAGKIRHLPNVRFLVYRQFRRSYSKLIAPCFEYCETVSDACILLGDMVFHTQSKALESFWQKTAPSASKIAYAVTGNWRTCATDNLWLLRAKELFSQFKAISVCGEEGRDLCRKTASVSAYDAIDPILLLQKTDYEKIMVHKPIFGCKTMLCWFEEKAVLQEMQGDVCDRLSRILDVEVKMMGKAFLDGNLEKNRTFVFYPAPLDFLRAVRDAAFIMTDCWQGIVFALLFEIPFICVIRDEDESFSKNRRLKDLLTKIDGMERLGVVSDAITMGALLEKKIDWANVRKKIDAWRQESLNWLKIALKD